MAYSNEHLDLIDADKLEGHCSTEKETNAANRIITRVLSIYRCLFLDL